ncbi:RidA family protein [Futiania mangrovi]|uniref:RidA family protein n=1 Tax=Futiania mangrovi TaxID=2959716 RepID=A0A9J6PA53_9PROT|nr:RidA family protein [Futiania mangrovii]MCP1335249.1 RidA family protein [Futiania mangrovii]
MSSSTEARLKALGITLGEPAKPVARYVPFVTTGKLVFVSGQVPTDANGVAFRGKLGADYTTEQGIEAARAAGINMLSVLKAACAGDLDRVARVVRLCGYINAVPEFEQQPHVMNGCSNLMVDVFGEEKGLHARTAIGVGSLPFNTAVEVDGIFELV